MLKLREIWNYATGHSNKIANTCDTIFTMTKKDAEDIINLFYVSTTKELIEASDKIRREQNFEKMNFMREFLKWKIAYNERGREYTKLHEELESLRNQFHALKAAALKNSNKKQTKCADYIDNFASLSNNFKHTKRAFMPFLRKSSTMNEA